MNKLRLIPRVSVWIVNISLLFTIIGLVFSLIGLRPLFGEGKRPESTEGMLFWTDYTSVNMGPYELSNVASYYGSEDDDEGKFVDHISLQVPFPRAGETRFANDSSDFRIINEGKYNMTADIDWKQSRPVVYHFYGGSEKNSIIALFICGLIVFYAIIFYWLLTLRGLMISMAKGSFFEMANFKRLIILSIPAFLVPVIQYVTGLISINFFQENFRIMNGGSESQITVQLIPMVFGIIFLLMAAMVYEGSKLKEDSDLTI